MAESSSVVERLLPDRGSGSAPSHSDQTFARAARSGDMESGHGPKVSLHLLALHNPPSAATSAASQRVQGSRTAPEAHTAGASGSDAAPASALSYMDILRTWIFMGWIGFGGPAAHIALFQKVFVEKLKWLTSTVFLELLALCQCMPGPTSTQVSFAIGVTQKGTAGGLLTGLLFQYPGLLLAGLVGVGAANWLKSPAPWLKALTSGGLAPVGVALVASAAKALTKSTCKDRVCVAINATAAVIVFYCPVTWVFPALIAAGGLVTLITRRKQVTTVAVEDEVKELGVGRRFGAALVLLWGGLLVASIVARSKTSYSDFKLLHWWEIFFRTGSIIFGGGQVVLPMLDSGLVGPGWISEADYYTGIALIQAMPGPLFNIAAYCGAVIAINAKVFPLIGIIICWAGLFAPGIMLIYGILPWWGDFRRIQAYRRALPGLNSAGVGLIVASVFQLGLKIRTLSPFPEASVCIGIIGYALVELGLPAPVTVGVGGVLGIIGWATGVH